MGVVIWKGHWPSSKGVAGVPETAEKRDDEVVLVLPPACRRLIKEKAEVPLPLLSCTLLLHALAPDDVLWKEA